MASPSTTSTSVTRGVVHEQRPVVAQRVEGLDGRGERQVVDRVERGHALPGEHEQGEQQRGERVPHRPSASSARRLTAPKPAPVTSRGRGRSTSISATTLTGSRRQHRHAVGEEDRLLDVVRHEQDRARLLGERVGEPALHRRARDRVERAERLVEQQHLAAGEERAEERHPLAHAARELGRARVLELGEAEALEERLGAPARLRARHALALEREGGVRERVAPGEEKVALRHVGAGGAPLGGARRAADGDDALVRLLEARHQLEQRGLAAAGRSDDGEHLVLRGPRGRCPLAAVTLGYRRVTLANERGSVAGASVLVCIAPSAGITPQVRRVGAGILSAISARIHEPPCWFGRRY